MSHPPQALEDIRTQRTDALLREALLELTAQKGFPAVTVSDITRYARINRATFYRHYEDKFDLLNKYVQAVNDLLVALPEPASMAPGLVAVFEHIRDNARFYRVMLGPHGDPAFAEKIRQYIKRRIWRTLPPELQKEDDAVDLYLSCSSSASVEAVLWWLDHDMPYSAEKMASISYQIGVHMSAMLEPSNEI